MQLFPSLVLGQNDCPELCDTIFLALVQGIFNSVYNNKMVLQAILVFRHEVAPINTNHGLTHPALDTSNELAYNEYKQGVWPLLLIPLLTEDV